MNRRSLCVSILLACVAVAATGPQARAEGGAPFDTVATPAEEPPEGAVWDLSRPFGIIFAQQRFLAPVTPVGELIPRAALAFFVPVDDTARWFFIVAGIANLALYHKEIRSWEFEASIFSMLIPVSSVIYYEGEELTEQQVDSSWTDVSLRFQKTFGSEDGLRSRIGGEYQVAARTYVAGEDMSSTFELPDNTAVHLFHLSTSFDTRARGISGDFRRGFEFEVGAMREVREHWNAWGEPGTGLYYGDEDAELATTAYAALEWHTSFDDAGLVVLHSKVRGGWGADLDRLTYIRLGGGGFGRQFDRVGAGSTGAANDGELFRSDGVPGYFGGEYFTDAYGQANMELDIPLAALTRVHVSAAYARFRDVQDPDEPWREMLGFGIGYTKIWDFEKALRIDLGYSPRPDGAFADTGDITFTYIAKF